MVRSWPVFGTLKLRAWVMLRRICSSPRSRSTSSQASEQSSPVRMPARYRLEAVTTLKLVRVPLALLDEPAWQPVCMALLRQQLCYKERKEAFLLLHSPEERYRELCRTFPHWPARLTQVQLANYIGISPVTLSRIRRRINRG